MASFNEDITGEAIQAVDSGEEFGTNNGIVSPYTTFEDGISEGRFVKLDSGSIDALDGSETPVVAGVLLREITGAVDSAGTTSTTYQTSVRVKEKGYVTVDATDEAEPSKFDAVYYINATTDTGKVTEDSTATGATAVDAYFVREVKTGVWLIEINKIAGA